MTGQFNLIGQALFLEIGFQGLQGLRIPSSKAGASQTKFHNQFLHHYAPSQSGVGFNRTANTPESQYFLEKWNFILSFEYLYGILT